MNDIYNAILKAADHIENYPDEFAFSSTLQPGMPHCGTPGCALGWIATFAGYKSVRRSFGAVARELLKVTSDPIQDGDSEFYERMEALGGDDKWQKSAAECARVLRLYVVKYHAPEPLPYVDIPAKVRAIFDDAPVAA